MPNTLLNGFSRASATNSDDNESIVSEELYKETHLRIAIKSKPSSLIPTQCEGNFYTAKDQKITSLPFTCSVACGNWSRVQQPGNFNLLDHLPQLVAIDKEKISLVTYQNGIGNTPAKFMQMGQLIFDQLPGKPLCIGLYNPSGGLMSDVPILGEELLSPGDTPIICATRQMFITFIDLFSKMKAKLHWLHIAHSKAGYITYQALKGIQDRIISNSPNDLYQQRFNYIKKHLIVATYGAVAPIPKNLAKKTFNTYSYDDKATWERFGKPLLKNEDYEISAVEIKCKDLNKKPEILKRIEGDHHFDGNTYQLALENNIGALNEKPKFYDSKRNF